MRGRDGDMAETDSVHATRFEAAVKVIQSLPKNGECGLGRGEGKAGGIGRGLAAWPAPAGWAGPGARGDEAPVLPLPPGRAAPGMGGGAAGRGSRAAPGWVLGSRRKLENRLETAVLVVPPPRPKKRGFRATTEGPPSGAGRRGRSAPPAALGKGLGLPETLEATWRLRSCRQELLLLRELTEEKKVSDLYFDKSKKKMLVITYIIHSSVVKLGLLRC